MDLNTPILQKSKRSMLDPALIKLILIAFGAVLLFGGFAPTLAQTIQGEGKDSTCALSITTNAKTRVKVNDIDVSGQLTSINCPVHMVELDNPKPAAVKKAIAKEMKSCFSRMGGGKASPFDAKIIKENRVCVACATINPTRRVRREYANNPLPDFLRYLEDHDYLSTFFKQEVQPIVDSDGNVLQHTGEQLELNPETNNQIDPNNAHIVDQFALSQHGYHLIWVYSKPGKLTDVLENSVGKVLIGSGAGVVGAGVAAKGVSIATLGIISAPATAIIGTGVVAGGLIMAYTHSPDTTSEMWLVNTQDVEQIKCNQLIYQLEESKEESSGLY